MDESGARLFAAYRLNPCDLSILRSLAGLDLHDILLKESVMTPAERTVQRKSIVPGRPPGKADTASRRPRSTPKRTPATDQAGRSKSLDREAMIAEAAYFRAMQRNFAPGFELEDWLEAEREIDGARSGSASGTNVP